MNTVNRLIEKYGHAACWCLSWAEIEKALAQGYVRVVLPSGIAALKPKNLVAS